MNNSIKLTIIKILKDTIDKIENDECSLDDEEILSIAKNLVHIKLNIEQTCNYIHVSRATLNRMIIDGRVPTPNKTLGGDKYWFQDELDDYNIELKENQLYDYVYVANMCKADFLGSSIDDERHLCLYVKDVIDDLDGYDGLVFNRWYADMCRQGIPIDWHEFI